jgi:heme A synthase
MQGLAREPSRTARAGGLARLLVLLLVSIVGLATLWQVIYGVSLGAGVAVVGETCVFVALAFVCAWRWTR